MERPQRNPLRGPPGPAVVSTRAWRSYRLAIVVIGVLLGFSAVGLAGAIGRAADDEDSSLMFLIYAAAGVGLLDMLVVPRTERLRAAAAFLGGSTIALLLPFPAGAGLGSTSEGLGRAALVVCAAAMTMALLAWRVSDDDDSSTVDVDHAFDPPGERRRRFARLGFRVRPRPPIVVPPAGSPPGGTSRPESAAPPQRYDLRPPEHLR